MEKSALAQEKVWFDKPSYDKAERLYFERMAKVSTVFSNGLHSNVIGFTKMTLPGDRINVSKHTKYQTKKI